MLYAEIDKLKKRCTIIVNENNKQVFIKNDAQSSKQGVNDEQIPDFFYMEHDIQGER